MRNALRSLPGVLLVAGILGACAASPPAEPAAPGQRAVVSFTTEDPNVAVELRPASASSTSVAPQTCTPPCTLQTSAGPAHVVVRQNSRSDQRKVDLAPGAQLMRVRPSDPTLRTLGWITAGVAVVALGVGIVASTYFKTDGQPSADGTQSSTPGWAKTALTASILSVVPLTLGSVFLLDRGSASVDVIRPGSPRVAVGWTSRF